jgi:hypothetical protein
MFSQRESINFPEYAGVRCLMMPYIQGELMSVPEEYHRYSGIIESTYLKKGDIGFLTIDESPVIAGTPHRGARAKYGRALHTEAGIRPESGILCWGGGGWGKGVNVHLDRNVKILLANNLDNSCAVWDTEHLDTSNDGDIGDRGGSYPYESARFMKVGEVFEIGILTPHESLPATKNFERQFLRIISSGVHGREEYFTKNPLMRN